MSLLDTIISQAKAQSAAEVVAVLAAIAYLVLAIREHISCWFFAALSTAIYVWILIDAQLYMESALNIFYFAMAVYGFISWRHFDAATARRPVVSWSADVHVMALVFVLALTGVSGLLLSRFTEAAFPYVDSLTTWMAIWATYLVTQKVLENWWYWLFIDALLVVMFWSRGLQLTSVLYVGYTLMIPFGLLAWRHSMRQQAA